MNMNPKPSELAGPKYSKYAGFIRLYVYIGLAWLAYWSVMMCFNQLLALNLHPSLDKSVGILAVILLYGAGFIVTTCSLFLAILFVPVVILMYLNSDAIYRPREGQKLFLTFVSLLVLPFIFAGMGSLLSS